MKKALSLFLALALCAGLSVPALAAEFTDVPAGHAFHDAIADCAAKGIASGYADGSFQPAASVTRAQFCVMLSRAFYPEAVQDNSTEANKALGWFVPNTEALAQAGVLEGASFASEYRAAETMNRPISRYDMARLMTNIMARKGSAASEEEKAAAAEKIADWSGIHDAYRDAVANVYALGIIGGYSDGTFSGTVTMNRGQGCAVIYRMTRHTGAAAESPAEAPGETPAPDGGLQAIRQGVLELVNAARAENGLSPLTLNDALCGAAQLRANEITQSFSHTRPDGTNCSTAVEEAGISFRSLGENIAAGQGSPASVMDSWMSSSGHRANILSGGFSSIGIGYVKTGSGYGHYWVQVFMD